MAVPNTRSYSNKYFLLLFSESYKDQTTQTGESEIQYKNGYTSLMKSGKRQAANIYRCLPPALLLTEVNNCLGRLVGRFNSFGTGLEVTLGNNQVHQLFG